MKNHGTARTGLILIVVIPAYSHAFSVHVPGYSALTDAANIADATRAPVYLYDTDTGVEWRWTPERRAA